MQNQNSQENIMNLKLQNNLETSESSNKDLKENKIFYILFLMITSLSLLEASTLGSTSSFGFTKNQKTQNVFTSKYLGDYEIVLKDKCSQVLHKKAFDICYSYKNKTPTFVVFNEYWNTVDKNNFKRKHFSFRSDYEIPRKFRSYPSDYTKSGYDRGHNAENAAFDYNKTIQKETFLTSNIAPQTPELNRVLWRKIEKQVRGIAVKQKKITVITGSCGTLGKIGRHNVNIPKYYYKIVLYKNDNKGKIITYLSLNSKKVGKDTIYEHSVQLIKVENICHFYLKKK